MRREVQLYIHQHPEYKTFIRQHPAWYRYLAREPQAFKKLETEVKAYYGKTFPQRLEQFQTNLNMAMMVIEMVKGLGTSGGE